MSFSRLTNYQLSMELQSVRQAVTEKMENNDFNQFYRDYKSDQIFAGQPITDVSEFNAKFKDTGCNLGMLHVNIRRLAKTKDTCLR